MAKTQSSILKTASGTEYFVEFTPSASPSPAPTLFCLHGLGNSTNFFYPLISALSSTHPIVRIDTPGHGRSPVAKKLSVPLFVSDLCDIIAKFSSSSPKPVIIGHSFGSVVSLQYVARHSANVSGLILLGAGRAVGQIPAMLDRFNGLAARARYGTWELADDAVPLNVAADASPAAKAYIREVIAGTDGEGYAQVCEAMISPDHVDPDYEAIQCPVLFLAGNKDVLSTVAKAEEIAELIRKGGNTEVNVKVVSSGHQHVIEDFEGTLSALKGFSESL